MKIRHPLAIKAVGVTGAWAIRRLVSTTRFHFRYADPTTDPEVARTLGKSYIYAFYHEVMLFPAYYWPWKSMQILISDHADGEMITQVVKRLGFSVVRGSTTRGGVRALREITWRVDQGEYCCPCFTPDGPRGPRRHVHQGMIYAASRMGLPIIGAGMAFRNPWRARSWDQFAVPRPFRPAACVVPPPIHVPPNADRDMIEEYRQIVERSMQQATAEAEEWVTQL